MDNFKKTSTIDGSTPEHGIWLCDTGQKTPSFDSFQLTTTWTCNVTLQALTVAKKCEISHWLPCGGQGRVDLGTYDHVATEISQMEMD